MSAEKTRLVTLDQLKRFGACSFELDRLERMFAREVNLSVGWARERADLCNWPWAAEHILSVEAARRYRSMVSVSRGRYWDAKDQATWLHERRIHAAKVLRHIVEAGSGRILAGAVDQGNRMVELALQPRVEGSYETLRQRAEKAGVARLAIRGTALQKYMLISRAADRAFKTQIERSLSTFNADIAETFKVYMAVAAEAFAICYVEDW